MSEREYQTELPVMPVKVISTFHHGDRRIQWRRRGSTDILEVAAVLEDKTFKPLYFRTYEGRPAKEIALAYARTCSWAAGVFVPEAE